MHERDQRWTVRILISTGVAADIDKHHVGQEASNHPKVTCAADGLLGWVGVVIYAPLASACRLPYFGRSAMAMSAGLAVLMAKVLVMISVIAAIMAFATVFGLSIPRRLEQMHKAGGRQRQLRCVGWLSSLRNAVTLYHVDRSAQFQLICMCFSVRVHEAASRSYLRPRCVISAKLLHCCCE